MIGQSLLHTAAAYFLVAAVFAETSPIVFADTFGSGSNMFDIEFVTIGNPGNVADTTGWPNPAGKVDYIYGIGRYEISEDMINKVNALGGLNITHNTRGANKPATSISWIDALQFVNWLNTDSGSTPAYNVDSNGNFQLWAPDVARSKPPDVVLAESPYQLLRELGAVSRQNNDFQGTIGLYSGALQAATDEESDVAYAQDDWLMTFLKRDRILSKNASTQGDPI